MVTNPIPSKNYITFLDPVPIHFLNNMQQYKATLRKKIDTVMLKQA